MTEFRRQFEQIRLRRAQLGRGLRNIEGIYIPDVAIGMIDTRACALEALTHVRFQDTYDDLDLCQIALLEFETDFRVVLKEHPRAPVKGVKIYADVEDAQLSEQLMRILGGIGISSERLIWTRRSVGT